MNFITIFDTHVHLLTVPFFFHSFFLAKCLCPGIYVDLFFFFLNYPFVDSGSTHVRVYGGDGGGDDVNAFPSSLSSLFACSMFRFTLTIEFHL